MQNTSLLTLPVKCTAAVTRERFVTGAGAHAAAAGRALGVTQVDGAIGDIVNADTLGTTIVTAGAAIALDAAIEVGANGKAVTLAAGTKVARALKAAAADGDRIEILLIPN